MSNEQWQNAKAEPSARLRTAAGGGHTPQSIMPLPANAPAETGALPAVLGPAPAREQRAGPPSSGDFYTPASLIRLMAELSGIQHGGKVYDPCCGSGAMLCGAALSYPGKDLQLYGQTLDAQAFSSCRMNLTLHGLSADLGDHPANTLLEDLHAGQAFDHILTNPPFNSSCWCESGTVQGDLHWPYGSPPRKNANFAWLQHIIRHLAPGGCAVVLLPNGTLTAQDRTQSEIRKRILLDGWVEAILALPAGLFHTTKIPCCAWVLRRDAARDTVLFIDARQLDLLGDARQLDLFERQDGRKTSELLCRYRSGKRPEATHWYAAASLEQIAQKNYVLSPNLYTLPKELTLPSAVQLARDLDAAADLLCSRIPASPLCESIRTWKTKSAPQDWNEANVSDLYTIFGGVSAAKDAFGRGTPMVDVKTVIRHMFLPDTLPARVALPDGTAPKYYLRRGDVLLNRTSETLDELACCSVALNDRDAVYGAYLKRLRPADGARVDPGYIAAYFRSRIYRQEIERVSFVYTTRANINLPQLAGIRLYYPDMAWQQAIGALLSAVIGFGQEHPDMAADAAIERFVRAFIEKFITYPVLLFRKERGEG